LFAKKKKLDADVILLAITHYSLNMAYGKTSLLLQPKIGRFTETKRSTSSM